MQKITKKAVVTSVRFPVDLYQAVKLQADELGIGISTIIKLALKEYLQKNYPERMNNYENEDA